MATQPLPINTLLKQNAVRRKSAGFRTVAETYHCRSIDLACLAFFRSRGMPHYGKMGNNAPR